MPRIDRTSASRPHSRLVLLLAMAEVLVTFGCNGSETVWSAQVPSPDGTIIATARTTENSGFGTGGVWTAVYLNWTKGRQQPTEILEIGDGPRAPGDTVVAIKWLGQRHLELAFNSKRGPVGFQAIKWGDVDISVLDTSASPR